MNNSSLPKRLFYVSCIVIVFTAGIAVGRYQVFPYPLLESGKQALGEVLSEVGVWVGFGHTQHAVPSHYDGNGVITNEPGRTVSGVTLLAGFFDGHNELRLIRADGSVMHRWQPSFFEAFRSTAHIRPRSLIPLSEINVEIHGAAALPDGSVVFNYEGVGTVKLDRCGAIQWTVPRMTHHALSPTAGGGFIIPSFRFIEDHSRYPAIAPPYLEPTVLKVAPDGAIRQEVSILDVFFRNNLAALLFANGLKGLALANKYGDIDLPNDVVHLNDAEELDASMADAFPQFRVGSLLLSLRDYNMVMVVDPDTLEVQWYQIGPWIGQHDSDFVEGGKISVFDNSNDGTETGSILGGSKIIDIDPSTRRTAVRYGGRRNQPMYTDTMGAQQHLGRNILITEAQSGRALEVTEQGEIVWEFINRVDDRTVNRLSGAVRYPENYFTLEDWNCNQSER
jgi:hypothetical protein